MKELAGKRFERLTVASKSDRADRNGPYWECVCECGKKVVVRQAHLLNGNTKSCGCLHKHTLIQRNQKHGGAHTKLYYVWQAMRKRCNDPRSKSYKYYGARGIKVSLEWEENYQRFRDWAISSGYKDGLTIDRIDTNKGYYPENCRWTNKETQMNNTRRNNCITHNGRTQTLSQWAKELLIKPTTLRNRIYTYGWSIEKAFTTKPER